MIETPDTGASEPEARVNPNLVEGLAQAQGRVRQLTVEDLLKPLPVSWTAQKRVLGFDVS